jgi:carbonic anhydrase
MSHTHDDLLQLLQNNKNWVNEKLGIRTDFFSRLKGIQTPQYLWIGCSDSRVPANEIVGLEPGELFVHRNIANVVVASDINCMSVIQYAVEILKVKHIIVTGHYGCGGVDAAMQNQSFGLMDAWLAKIKAVYQKHQQKVDQLPNPDDRLHLMCELNVREQVLNVCQTSIVQNAWKNQQSLTVHGWIFDISDGVLVDLHTTIDEPGNLSQY